MRYGAQAEIQIQHKKEKSKTEMQEIIIQRREIQIVRVEINSKWNNNEVRERYNMEYERKNN